MSEKKCLWCHGKGRIFLKSMGDITCFNCKGSGKGKDGGDEGLVSGHRKPWMIGNKYGSKENRQQKGGA